MGQVRTSSGSKWREVLSGDEPLGYLASSRDGGYDLVVQDAYQRLNLHGCFLVVKYELVDTEGEDEIWVLCVAKELTTDRDLPMAGDFELRALDLPLTVRISSQALRGRLVPLSFYSERSGRLVEMRGLPLANSPVYLLKFRDLNTFIPQQEWHFRLGYLVGSNHSCGAIIRHFGEGGWGDALMAGVFGPTGSGKTFLASQLLAGYGRYENMGLLILDYQGQLSRVEANGQWGNLMRPGEESWYLSKCFAHRRVHLLKANELAFERANLFVDFLAKGGYFKHFTISSGEKMRLIRSRFIEHLDEYQKHYKVKSIAALTWSLDWYQRTQEIIASCYKEPEGAQIDIDNRIEYYEKQLGYGLSHYEKAGQIWEGVLGRFRQKQRLSEMIDNVLCHGDVVILSFEGFEEGGSLEFADDKLLYYAEIFQGLVQRAQRHYYAGRAVNALVFVDEAQALFSSTSSRVREWEGQIQETLIQAVRTTRKLGLGWLFNSTSLRGLPTEIYEQLNTKFLGAGLLQNEADEGRIRDVFGGNSYALNQYRALPRPRNAGTYIWAVVGEMQPLGSGTVPLFLRLFRRQEELFRANPHWFVDKSKKL